MPFQPDKPGYRDEKINRDGRPVREKSNRERRQESLASFFRKVKPNLKLSVQTLTTICDDPKIKPEVRLQAAKLLLDYQLKLTTELYGKIEPEADAPGVEIPEAASVLSFTMVDGGKSVKEK